MQCPSCAAPASEGQSHCARCHTSLSALAGAYAAPTSSTEKTIMFDRAPWPQAEEPAAGSWTPASGGNPPESAPEAPVPGVPAPGTPLPGTPLPGTPLPGAVAPGVPEAAAPAPGEATEWWTPAMDGPSGPVPLPQQQAWNPPPVVPQAPEMPAVPVVPDSWFAGPVPEQPSVDSAGSGELPQVRTGPFVPVFDDASEPAAPPVVFPVDSTFAAMSTPEPPRPGALAAEQPPVPPAPQNGLAAAPPHVQPEYVQPEYVQPEYAQPEYGQPEHMPQYAQPEYAQAERTQQYGQPEQAQSELAQQYGQPESAERTQQYVQPQYAQPEQVQPEQTQQYGQPEYAQAERTQQYAQPEYAQQHEPAAGPPYAPPVPQGFAGQQGFAPSPAAGGFGQQPGWNDPRDEKPLWDPNGPLPMTQSHRSPSAKGGAKNKPLLIGVAALVAVAVASVAFVFLNGGDDEKKTVRPSKSAVAQQPVDLPAADSAAAKQARQVQTLLNASAKSRGVLGGALVKARKCAALPESITAMQQVAQQRRTQWRRARQLDVAELPDGAKLRGSLARSFKLSLDVDLAYLSWARAHQGCKGKTPPKGAHYKRGAALSAQATQAKSRFLKLWNPVAPQYGLPKRKSF